MAERPSTPEGAQPEDLAAMLAQFFTESADNPEIVAALKQMGIDPENPQVMAAMTQQVKSMFDPVSGPPVTEVALTTARQTVAMASTDPSARRDRVLGDTEQRAVAEAVTVASLWLDPVTTLVPSQGRGRAWSRAEWVEATMPQWHTIVQPVAAGVSRAIGAAMTEQFSALGELDERDLAELGLPEIPGLTSGDGPLDLSALASGLAAPMEQASSQMFAAVTGQAVGALGIDVVTGTEVILPITSSADIALLPTNIESFAEGLGIDAGQVRLYLAVREAARSRLYAGAPWLGPLILAAVQDYARSISIDTDAISSAIADAMSQAEGGSGAMELQDPAAIARHLQGKLFAPTPTPAGVAALARLETLLALTEGWVDVVTDRATAAHLPQAGALNEAIRRRRLGGPAQRTFSGLVGLDLTPRRLRDAANLWAALEADGGADQRDAPWAHPDLAPTAADLDDPLGFVERMRAGRTASDMDAALDALLRGEDPATS